MPAYALTRARTFSFAADGSVSMLLDDDVTRLRADVEGGPDYNELRPSVLQRRSVVLTPSDGAWSSALEGEAPTVQRRAAVVGAPLAFAPDETSFAEGFAAFRERHALRLSEQRGSARARAFAIARTLLLSAAPEDAEGQSEAEEAAELDAPVWDAARVCRHLERSAAAAYQVLRRASWLCLLAESVVTFREPRARVGRSLVLQGARVVELADQGADEVVSLGPRRRRGASREAFDAARYDELRILTTELKRILRDGGEVAVRLSARRVLSGSRLASLLRLV